ncbi:MAG TPA: OmpA family protein [Chitinispirillaceae bacterium]|nr:OmpA family protein [Chitinispirillaceae bacterium]
MRKLHTLVAVMLCGSLIAGCGWNHMARGGTIGAGIGAVVGGLVGYKAGNTAVGAIVGAAVGGTAGAAIGRYMDKQAAEIRRDLNNAKVERVGEGIKITFNSGILFDVNSHVLRNEARQNVNELARILNKYKDTEILVEGHTDSTGSDRYNTSLSENRASSVSYQLKSQGVSSARISINGYGESQPVADNSTVSGRQQNRRVEIAIFANDKLKRAARNGTI